MQILDFTKVVFGYLLGLVGLIIIFILALKEEDNGIAWMIF